MAFLDHLAQTITRRRIAKTADSSGGYSESNTDITFDGLIVMAGAEKALVGGRDTASSSYRLYYPPATDLVSADVIIDAAGNSYDATTPNNVQAMDAVGQMDLVLKRDRQ